MLQETVRSSSPDEMTKEQTFSSCQAHTSQDNCRSNKWKMFVAIHCFGCKGTAELEMLSAITGANNTPFLI